MSHLSLVAHHWISACDNPIRWTGPTKPINVPHYLCIILNSKLSLHASPWKSRWCFPGRPFHTAVHATRRLAGRGINGLSSLALVSNLKKSHETWETWHAERSAVRLIKLLRELLAGNGAMSTCLSCHWLHSPTAHNSPLRKIASALPPVQVLWTFHMARLLEWSLIEATGIQSKRPDCGVIDGECVGGSEVL